VTYFCRELKYSYLISLLLLFACTTAAGQKTDIISDWKPKTVQGSLFGRDRDYRDTVWIVTGYKPLDGNFKKWKFDFSLDARQSIISNTTARIGGIRIGMEYRRVHRFGIGFYGMGDKINTFSLDEVNSAITEASFTLRYNTFYYERVLFFNKKWEVSSAFHLGRGKIKGDYLLLGAPSRQSFPEKDVRLFEISSTAYYHINWWIDAGVGIGYRQMNDIPQEVKPIYNAPVAILRVRIKFGKLIKSIWDHDIKHTY
jgi:hypothetical protein